MKQQDWKERLGVVYSTNPDYAYDVPAADEPDTLPPAQQRLRVRMERAGRKGKTVTLVTGFVGTADDLKALGTAKDGEIVSQGGVRERVVAWLRQAGYADVR